MATIVAPGTDRKSAERKFYTRMAFFLVVACVAGLRAELLSEEHRPGLSAAQPHPSASR